MTQHKTVYLIDGTAYIHRAYHAVRSLSTSKGFPSNAVFGFTRMLIKLIEDKAPEYVAMFFDSKGPTFRHKIYSEYKANRPPMADDMAVQIPYIKEVTAGFNIPIYEQAEYEADDLIGTVAPKAVEQGFDVIMVTGDKDFMQLITDKITIWDPMKNEVIDRNAVFEKHGLEPFQMLDVLGLAGDSADNIPGVPGIGPKTAITLLKSFSSMKQLYDQIDQVKAVKQREKLIAYKEQAFMSRELAKINTQVPIPIEISAFKLTAPDNLKLAGLFKELEFRQLQKAYPISTDLTQKQYQPILDEISLSGLIDKLTQAEVFAVDTETTAVNPMAAKLVGLSFAVKPDEGFYIPCGHRYPGAPEQLNLDYVLNRLKPLLEDPDIKKIGQNIKYDWTVLKRHGVNLSGVIFDTMLASYLINPEKRAHNLDQIALDFLDHKMISYKEAVASDDRKINNFSEVDLEKAVPYACEDADITLMAYEKFTPMLESDGLTRLFKTVEMPLIPVLMKMEMAGIRVDKDRLVELSKDLAFQLEQTEQQIYSVAGEEFNINSSQQLGKILFDKLKLPVQKKTKKKTAYSTDVDVLTILSDRHELPALVLRHRSMAKLKSTYVDALFELINPETGRVHTSYNQTVTATGRLSSSNPNLQNIPIRTEEGRKVRRAFIPKDGWLFVSMDYSQIELRLLAHYSDDEILIDAFTKGEDIHTRTASEVFQALPVMITNELRQQAKVINFGIMYGMSAFSLSKELKISQKMAKTYIDHYFKRYSGVKRFIDSTIETAKETKLTSTELGRIRLLPDINSKNANIRGFAERTAVNTKIQGTAADLIKLAMIKVDAALSANGLQSKMLLSVHDEIVFEVPSEELDTIKKMGKEIMENIWEFKVPLKVNVATGKDWAEAH
ncbi:MAG: DNA polymerase I [Desulfobacteraceae bacterium]|nr:DNA polymerase I [Desulfobacteraceae bacterium]MBC2757637.1 DNA polymerase I [Desulfobacteraceae bacterium]MBC2763882.1 DNA polymerase I [ANME-2 cluster archaeon]